MKTRFSIVSFLFLISNFFATAKSTTTPAYAVELIPDSLLQNANTVIRSFHHQYEVKNIGEATERVKAVITILNDKSSYNDLQIYYDQFTKIGKIKAQLFDAKGKHIRDLHKSEIKDFAAFDGFSIYNDNRLKNIDFTYGTYPYTIAYEYDVSHKGLQSYASWYPQQYKTSVEKSIFELRMPNGMDFRSQSENMAITAEVTTEAAMDMYKWELQNLKVVGREPNTPDSYRPLPVLLTLPNDFKVDGYVGNMETWESFGRFMYKLNENRDKLSPQMFQKVQSLTANAKNNAEKIAILYQYLQENMRYVSVQLGIGGWQTFDANYVEQNKYGDCKALTNFMKGMLKAVGIKAYASLVVAGDQRLDIKEDFTTPYFNHVILNVPDENIWLECTSTNNPVNYLGANTEDRPTLLITEKGGVLTKTPKIDQNQQIGKTTISLTNEGAAIINSHIQLTGKLHDWHRYIVHNYSPDKQQKWFVRSQNFPTFQTKKLDLSVSKMAPEATCNYTIEVNRYASKAGKRLFVPLNLVNKFGRSLPKDANRTQPIAFELGYEDTDEIIFTIPASYKVESLPKNVETLKSPYGQYEVSIEEKEGQVIYRRKLLLYPVNIPASEYNDLRTFYRKIAKMDSAKLVLVRRSA